MSREGCEQAAEAAYTVTPRLAPCCATGTRTSQVTRQIKLQDRPDKPVRAAILCTHAQEIKGGVWPTPNTRAAGSVTIGRAETETDTDTDTRR